MKMIKLKSIGNPMFYVDDVIKTGKYEKYPYCVLFTYLVMTIGSDYNDEVVRITGKPLDKSKLLRLYSLTEKIIVYPYKTVLNQFIKSFLLGLEKQIIEDLPKECKDVKGNYERLLHLMEQLNCDYIYSSSDQVISQITSFMESIKVSNS
jgi:hypothetical protein